MLNAIQRRSWGEEFDIHFDPTAFVEAIEPVVLDALKAVDDREEMAAILIDLYRSHGQPGMLARVLEASVWTGSRALYEAVETTVDQAGRAAVTSLEETLPGVEREAVGYLFDHWRAAVQVLCDPAKRLDVLHRAYAEILGAIHDRDAAEALGAAQRFAGLQDGQAAAEAMLGGLSEALVGATDPWSILAALFEDGHPRSARIRDPAQLLWPNLSRAIAGEGPDKLWSGYTYFRNEWEADEMESALALQEMYLKSVKGVADPRWFADRVIRICFEIAHASHDWSCWLPSRVQVARACERVVANLAGTAVANEALVRGLADAVEDGDEPLGTILEAAQRLLTTAADPSEGVRVLVEGLGIPSPSAAGAGLAG
ncbi:MAG: hypothetical protein F4179_01040 [Gammaproteobacteria bacterium]|nr:hypothetical protein [Gammaproteobacteria bacterium]